MWNAFKFFLFITCITITSVASAEVTVTMFDTAATGAGPSVGTIVISETKYGLLFTPNLTGLSPGLHGFHIHENPSCDSMAMAAGGHWDPAHSLKHLGPYNDAGHLGDLPVLYVNNNGAATVAVLAPRIQHLTDINNHALMIHEGGDNYSDTPKLGGGGARMVCGIIK